MLGMCARGVNLGPRDSELCGYTELDRNEAKFLTPGLSETPLRWIPVDFGADILPLLL